MTSSSDHGNTWRPANRVDEGTYNTQFNPRQFPVVGPDGALYVMYDIGPATVTVAPSGQIGAIKIGIARSTDGSQTFQRTIVDGDVHRIESPDEALRATSRRSRPSPPIRGTPGGSRSHARGAQPEQFADHAAHHQRRRQDVGPAHRRRG